MSVLNFSRRAVFQAGGASALVLGWAPRPAEAARGDSPIDDSIRLGAQTDDIDVHLNQCCLLYTSPSPRD